MGEKEKEFQRLCNVIVPYIAENLWPYVMQPPIQSCGDWGQSQFQLGEDDESNHQILSNGLLSIIFLTPQILRHPPCWCDLLRPSCNHHQLYPIPIAPSARYHVKDLPYDLQTTLLYFSFLVSSLLPNASFCGLTDHRLLQRVIGTLPYISPHMNLVLILLIVCI